MADLSIEEARRIALAAQGFADPLPAKPTKRHLHRVMARTGVLQLDSVNIVARPQYVVQYSRIGPYDPRALHEIAYHDRAWFEYWAHEASLIPVENYRLFRPRMEHFRNHANGERPKGKWDQYLYDYLKTNRSYMDRVLEEIRDRGPLSAGQLTDGGRSTPGVMWGWSPGKRAVETLFRSGELAATRKPSFERVYDLPERVVPKDAFDAPIPCREDAERELLLLAARSLGVATVGDLADYYRAKKAATKLRVEELVSSGALERVGIEDWKEPAFVLAGTSVPKRVRRAALLTPFDPMVWDRKRALRLFGFDYRIEIYTPAPKRIYGYYVMPFLHNERLAARVDLKADRKSKTLQVLAAWKEDHATADDAAALAAELDRFASFLNLERVSVAGRGTMSRDLKRTRRTV